MDSVIFLGMDAIAAAKYTIRAFGGDCEGFDLGPDFGQDAARLIMDPTIAPKGGPQALIQLIERWRDINHWYDGVGADFRVVFDGPPYSLGGVPSVEGTPL